MVSPYDDHDESDIDVLVLLDGCDTQDRHAVSDLAASINLSLVTSDSETYQPPGPGRQASMKSPHPAPHPDKFLV